MPKEKIQTEITLYGVRGGQPTSSRPKFSTTRYGGNTTHYLVKHDKEYSFIDGGTGITVCGDDLLSKGIGIPGKPLQADLYFTHFHADHVDGILFFGPMYIPGNNFYVFGRNTGAVIEEILSRNQQIRFPVDYLRTAKTGRKNAPVMESTRTHTNVYAPPQNRQLIVIPTPTCHPDGCVAYRFTDPKTNTAFVFGGDHEFKVNAEIDENLGFFCKEVSFAILDAQYSREEYTGKKGIPAGAPGFSRKGWGHSSYEDAIDFGLKWDVQKLILTHHDRLRDDNGMDRFSEDARTYLRNQQGSSGMELVIAEEGMKINV